MSNHEFKQRLLRAHASRLGLAALDCTLPALAGKWATAMFMATRSSRRPSGAHVPIGAKAISIDGHPGIRDAYVWGKSGPLVLLVHGWSADSGTMSSLVRPLRESGCRVVAFDAPAHGANEGRRTTMTRFVGAVRHVLDNLDPRAEVQAVIGHSLGGLAAVAAVQSARRLPRRLVLLSTPSSLNEVLRTFVGFWKLSPRIEQRIHEELAKSHGVPIEHWDVRTLASPGRFPALVVHDRRDPVVPFSEAEVVTRSLGGSVRLEQTEGLGHARSLTDPRTTRLVADFVAAARASSASNQRTRGEA